MEEKRREGFIFLPLSTDEPLELYFTFINSDRRETVLTVLLER
jgi:hypothetical protein